MTLTEYEMADLAMSAQATATPTTALFVIFALAMLASIPGCLKFMWDVRHPKPD